MEIDISSLTTRPTVDADRIFVSVYLTNSLQEAGFKGFAKSISSFDEKGPFDILPSHENFVTEFSQSLEIVPFVGEKIHYSGIKGVLEVADNVVRIFLENKK